jgi:hypothetical protein
MPYRTKAELDRENWKTIPDAVADICAADHCEARAARDQLRKALADDDSLWPLRWQLEKRDRTPEKKQRDIPFSVPDDLPPHGRVWSEAKIRWQTGRVRDDWGDYNKGKWRVLLIHRLAVGRHWPQPDNSGIRSRHGSRSSAQVINLSTRNLGGRPTASEQVYDALRKMRDEGYDMRQPQKRLAEEAAKGSGKKLGEPNWDERTIIGHVSKWLHNNGLA